MTLNRSHYNEIANKNDKFFDNDDETIFALTFGNIQYQF